MYRFFVRARQKVRYAVLRVKVKVRKVLGWASENPMEAVAIASIAAGAASSATKLAGKALQRANIERQAYLEDTRLYDPSAGHYYTFKRRLSNQEWVEIERRHAAGERYGAILSSMNVLK